MKKVFGLLMAALLMLGSCAAENQAADYYAEGLKVTKLMGEIAGSEDYLSLLSGQNVEAVREKVDTKDYDAPTAVYAVGMKDREGFLKQMLAGDMLEIWEKLPEELRQQIIGKINVQTICNVTNGRQSVDNIAFASVSVATVQDSGIEPEGEESLYYLYVFEKGTPVLVSFGYHAAGGMFLFLTKEETASLAALQQALPNLEITPVEIP